MFPYLFSNSTHICNSSDELLGLAEERPGTPVSSADTRGVSNFACACECSKLGQSLGCLAKFLDRSSAACRLDSRVMRRDCAAAKCDRSLSVCLSRSDDSDTRKLLRTISSSISPSIRDASCELRIVAPPAALASFTAAAGFSKGQLDSR